MRALPVDVVRAFIAIVDCRGFTRAAEQLGPHAADDLACRSAGWRS